MKDLSFLLFLLGTEAKYTSNNVDGIAEQKVSMLRPLFSDSFDKIKHEHHILKEGPHHTDLLLTGIHTSPGSFCKGSITAKDFFKQTDAAFTYYCLQASFRASSKSDSHASRFASARTLHGPPVLTGQYHQLPRFREQCLC